MKRKYLSRIAGTFLLTCLCLSAFSVPAFAGGPEYTEPETTGDAQEEPSPEEPRVTAPLTPEGNLTLVDDITAEGDEDKQFITVVSKNGNYFYLVIDRSKDGENNVHFLNLVDEADLLALIEDKDSALPETTPIPICTCTDKCRPGEVDMTCEICKNDLSQCKGTETVSPEPEPEPAETNSVFPAGPIIGLILVLALAGGGAVYYFKAVKPKKTLVDDLEDFDLDGPYEDETEEPDAYAEPEDGYLDDGERVYPEDGGTDDGVSMDNE